MLLNKLPCYGGDGAEILTYNTWVVPDEHYEDLAGRGIYHTPHNCSGACAVELNGELHLLGGSSAGYENAHYKWNGQRWDRISTLPYKFSGGVAVVLNEEIHIIGGGSTRNHFKWDGAAWLNVSTHPIDVSSCSIEVLGREIHRMGGNGYNTDHYIFDGNEWKLSASMPLRIFDKGSYVINEELHIYRDTQDYKWNGDGWEKCPSLPMVYEHGKIIVLNNELHLLYNMTHYMLDGQWVPVANLPLNFTNGFAVVLNDTINVFWNNFFTITKPGYCVGTERIPNWTDASQGYCKFLVFNGEVHALIGDGGKFHSKWDGDKWVNISELPYVANEASVTIFNGEIHLLGGNYGDAANKHYKWNGDSWVNVSTLPYRFYDGSAIELDGKLHLLSSSANTSVLAKHYKWDGTSWEMDTDTPFNFNGGEAVILNNELHIMGSVNGTAHSKKHYKWNGSTWSSVSELPNYFGHGSAVVLNKKIYIMGGSSREVPYRFYSYDGTWRYHLITFDPINSPSTSCVYRNMILIHSKDGMAILYCPEKEKIKVRVKKGFTIYTNCEFDKAVVSGNTVLIDGVMELNAHGEHYLTILNKRKVVCLKTGGSLDGEIVTGYFLKGMRVNGQLITEDGIQTVKAAGPLYIET